MPSYSRPPSRTSTRRPSSVRSLTACRPTCPATGARTAGALAARPPLFIVGYTARAPLRRRHQLGSCVRDLKARAPTSLIRDQATCQEIGAQSFVRRSSVWRKCQILSCILAIAQPALPRRSSATPSQTGAEFPSALRAYSRRPAGTHFLRKRRGNGKVPMCLTIAYRVLLVRGNAGERSALM